MSAAIEILDAVGLDSIEKRIEELTDRLKAAVPDAQLLSPAGFESGLVTIDVAEPDAVVEALRAEGIRIRSLPEPDAVRASVHAFNTEAEIDALVAALEDCGGLD